MADTKAQARAWGGFGKDDELDLPMEPGLYPGRLVRVELIDTQYGERARLVFQFDYEGETRTVSDLAGVVKTSGAKFIRYLAAANGIATVTDELELSSLKDSGPVVAKITIDDKGFNRIDDVMPPSMTRTRNRKAAGTEPAPDADELPF